ncbi:Gfo/Idh/MocA family protein [Phytoactinopolyspora halotolerans]|uniref:Gfo/Idh/MocA family oxidoreductase n=1 Tax=Phytoactinopolyspora halotolerans TaxID=1981512 RepID=A0A6L9S970_9ACTN|nr:Gfo/Idh/MocA family oxidoreductase [Phytoactinopolyspora halotolerans]NEE01965.1 Gfo/Idh/MocA family oxidoreductase [Phytoactinopolyspora halotolerans]
MTVTPLHRPVRLIQVGAGAMGQAWLRTVLASDDAQLVGLVDLDQDAARRGAEAAGLPDLPIGTSVTQLAREVDADAVLNVTVPVAHHPVSLEAMFAGFPVLCEKPVAPTVAQALSMVAASEVTGQLLMISQSRRYFRSLRRFRRLVRELGEIGTIGCEFFKAPHFGGFREQMDHPLLVDMAIHHFDAARYLIGAEPVSVYCDAYNPGWSWYAGDAAAVATFEFTDGARFVYNGSWCAPGAETSWNGRWRVSSERGTAMWDGDHDPTTDVPDNGDAIGDVDVAAQPDAAQADDDMQRDNEPEEIAGSLAEFIHVLRTGATPSGEVHGNVLSLSMVEAAVQSASTRQRIALSDVLAASHTEAIQAEQRDDVRATLEKWKDVRETVGLVF